MSASTIHSLNGARIYTAGDPRLWLVFHGTRHHIAGPAVYKALFNTHEGMLQIESVDYILRGPDLNEGSCLIQSEGEDAIYLLTGSPDAEVRKHQIFSPGTFGDFAFDHAKILRLPKLALVGITTGEDIRSALE